MGRIALTLAVAEVRSIDLDDEACAHRAQQARGSREREVAKGTAFDDADHRLGRVRSPPELPLRPADRRPNLSHHGPDRYDGIFLIAHGLFYRGTLT